MNEKNQRRKQPLKYITSYGLILFCVDHNDGEPRFLIYQRRDNYEYIDILRGNWNNEHRLRELFSALSSDEKERIRTHSFKELWDDLWITKENNIHRDGYEKARQRFESYVKDKLDEYLKCGPDNLDLPIEPPWGFPKGKRNDRSGETSKECALREFSEETHLPIDDIVIWDTNHFSEYYKGNNSKPYCTFYYVAETKTQFPVRRYPTPGCIRKDTVSNEAEDAQWMTYREACEKLCPRRQTILKQVLHLIKTSYSKYSLHRDLDEAIDDGD